MEQSGFVHTRASGSHLTMDHPNCPQTISIQSDKNGMAKAYQARQARDSIKVRENEN